MSADSNSRQFFALYASENGNNVIYSFDENATPIAKYLVEGHVVSAIAVSGEFIYCVADTDSAPKILSIRIANL